VERRRGARRSHYLAEEATGAFFDTDLVLANPTDVAAPVWIWYLNATGSSVGQTF
jgi:hypothetical protein